MPGTEKRLKSNERRAPRTENRVPSTQRRETSIQNQASGSSPFRPGDALFIDTFPDTSFVLNRYFPIDDRGMAEFPMIGNMKVTDLSQERTGKLFKVTI